MANNIVPEKQIDELVEAGHLTPTNATPPPLPSNFAALTNPYPSGSLPLDLQYAPDLLNTQTRGGSIPQIRLMPVMPAGNPGVNSANSNAVAPVQKAASNAQVSADAAMTTANGASADAAAAQSTATTAASGVSILNSTPVLAVTGDELTWTVMG